MRRQSPGIICTTGILDVVINRFENVADRAEAAKTLGTDAWTVRDICKQVKKLAKKHARFSFDDSITKSIEECLQYFEDVTKRYDDNAAFLRVIVQ
jgi:hypothetical protein